MRSHIAAVNGIKISYTVEGNGPPVVLIHGLACGKRMWLHQVRSLSSHFTVITFDQRGHGLSTAPTSPSDYSGQHLARDLIGLLNHLEIDRCNLVGFSLGGGPAISVAISNPERVARLILADVGSGADNLTLISSMVRNWLALVRRTGAEGLVEEMLRSDFFKTYARQSSRNHCYMRGLILGTPLNGLAFTLSEVLAKRPSMLRMGTSLKSVEAETLVLRGRDDYVCRASSKFLADVIPRAALQLVPGAGHMVPLEEPGLFNAAVLSFLSGP